jgi:hypothetical protein
MQVPSGAPSGDGVQHQRHKMRLWLVELAHLCLGIGARHVEIAENHMAQAVRRLEVAQHVLDRAFRGPIGVDRVLRAAFIKKHIVLIAIGGTGGGEHEIKTTRRHRRLDQAERPGHVVMPVKARRAHALAHLAEGGEMHDRLRLIGGKDLIEPRTVGQAPLLEGAEFHRLAPAGAEIVIGDGGIARLRQSLAGVAADIARAAGDQNIAQARPRAAPYCAALSAWTMSVM